MTREEAKTAIESILSEATEYKDAVCYVTEQDAEPLKIAIEALEQDKPMAEIDLYSVIKQSYIEREVLDKIRAEIVKKHLSVIEKNDFESGRTYGYEEVLEIIDKYRQEGIREDDNT